MRISRISWWAAVVCLVVTFTIWFGFLLLRLNPGPNPTGPIVAHILLGSLILSGFTTVGAVAFSTVALIFPPRVLANWLVFGISWMVLFGMASLFLLTRMM